MKLRKITILLIALTMLVVPLFSFVQPTNATWWDSDWDYYKVCNIDDNGYSENYQMKINVTYSSGGDVDCEGHCQADFDDIRFVDIDNSTELSYWRETYASSDYAIFWVNVSADAISDGKILMYYGNSTATDASDGDNTFLLFDDFNDGSLNTTKWSGNTSSFTEANGYLECKSSSKLLYASSLSIADVAVESRTSYSSGGRGALISRYSSNTYYYGNYRKPNSDIRLVKVISGSATQLTLVSHTFSNSWDRASLRIVGSSLSFVYDGTTTNTTDTSITSAGSVGVRTVTLNTPGTDYIRWDWMAVRKYASTEPSWSSFGSEQTNTGGWTNSAPTFSGNQPTGTGISLTPMANVTINDADGNATVVDWYISTDNSTWGSPSRHVASHTANTSDSYTVSEATNYGTKYYIKVTANDSHDNSTIYWNFTTASLPSMSTESATSVTSTSATLHGTVVTYGDATVTNKFYVDDATEYSSCTPATSSADDTQYYKTLSFNAGTYHYYVARGTNSAGTTTATDTEHFLTAPGDPSSFTAIANGQYEIDLSWANGAGGDGAYIEYSTSPDATWSPGDHTKIDADGYIAGTSFSHTGLSPGTHYYYKICNRWRLYK